MRFGKVRQGRGRSTRTSTLMPREKAEKRSTKVRVYHLTPKGRAAMERGYNDTPKWKARALGWKLALATTHLLLIPTRDFYAFANDEMIGKAVETMLTPNGAQEGDYRVEVER